MLKYALILALLPAVIYAGRITFTACNGGGPTPQWAEIDGCSETECRIQNGSPVTFRASHTAVNPASSLETTLTAFISIIPVTLELPDNVRQGCQTIAGDCPVEVGETRDVGATFVVQATISNVSPAIEFRMVNEAGQVFVCVRTNIVLHGIPA